MIYYNVLSGTLKVPLNNESDEIMVFSDNQFIIRKEVSYKNENTFSFNYEMDNQAVDVHHLHVAYFKAKKVILVITDEIVDNVNDIKVILNEMQLYSYIDYMKVKNHIKKYGGNHADVWNFLKENSCKKFFWVFGNCQSTYFNYLLLSSKSFKDKYVLVTTPPVQWLEGIEKINGFRNYFLHCIDLFVYQHIDDDSGFSNKLSSTNIIRNMLEGTGTICIPNAYFNGYYPVACTNSYEVRLPEIEKIFPYADKNIDKLLDEGKEISEIVDILSSTDFYSPEVCQCGVKTSLNELREREKLCDIIISDFIEQNYKKQRLFYTFNHPINIVLHEILKRIFSQIGLKDDIIEDEVEENNTYEIPIYPSIQVGLQLEFYEKKINYCKRTRKGEVTFAEYIYDYCQRRTLLKNAEGEKDDLL